MLDLLGDGDKLVPPADTDAEQPGQRMNHFDRIRVASLLTHPRNGIQGIIEEMGVDLSLERLQLRFAQIDFFLTHSRHQPLDAQDHVSKGIRQLPHLLRPSYRVVGKVVGISLKVLHSGGQAAQRPAQEPGEQPAGQHRRYQHHHRQHHGQLEHLAHIAVDQFIHIADTHDPPVAALHAGQAVYHGIVCVGAVRQGGQRSGVLRF